MYNTDTLCSYTHAGREKVLDLCSMSNDLPLFLGCYLAILVPVFVTAGWELFFSPEKKIKDAKLQLEGKHNYKKKCQISPRTPF